ncbi:MAG TPA: methylated-DNA--[protein]-cysteine S-methyltransferase [Anaerolineales bacterium]|nr:methylated-DNA--[protein]-cysteine S-methyltransferase [Anaerolineales bacterium]
MSPTPETVEIERWLQGGEARGALAPVARRLDEAYQQDPPVEAWHRAERRLRRDVPPIETPVFYDSVPKTLVGKLWVGVTDHGLVAVSFGGPEAEFRAQVARKTGRTPHRSAQHTAEVRRQLEAYLQGRRGAFTLDVDLRHVTPFQREVLTAAQAVPRGQVVTYGQIARRIGRPRATRAIGQALGSNPIPIVVPCHRVLAADGSLGGYSGRGGTRTKRRLLQLEGAALP